jgi:hypothetical protein
VKRLKVQNLSWIKKKEDMERARKIKGIVPEIKGVLKHVKKSSVELQHEARKLRMKKKLHDGFTHHQG